MNRPWYNIVLSGGEPTINPYISNLISMLYESLGARLNKITIMTNGSRNVILYKKISDISKEVHIKLHISIHTDHVDMSHILELIETLSRKVTLNFLLLFNPNKRDFVHEIYDILYQYRKKYWFQMSIITIRDGNKFDPRYTPEDFTWHKETQNKFRDLEKNVSAKLFAQRTDRYLNALFRETEENGEFKTGVMKRTDQFEDMFNFKGMYCMAHSTVLRIEEDGNCRGMVCGDDKIICNIYEKNSLLAVRDKLIHVIKCTRPLCGCAANDPIPKFASEKDAKKYVEFAKKRQAELFSEYDAAHSFKII